MPNQNEVLESMNGRQEEQRTQLKSGRVDKEKQGQLNTSDVSFINRAALDFIGYSPAFYYMQT